PITSNGEQETVDVVSGLEALTQSETAVVTPLQLYGEKIGGLGVRVSPDKPLDEDQQAILKAISDQVVEALERARLTEQTEMALAETEEQARRRARLNQLSEDLTRTQDLETIYDIVTGAALEMVGGDRTTLMLLSDDQKTVTVLVAHGDVAQVPLNTPLPADAIVRGVIKSRTATLLNDPPGKGGPGGVVSSIVAPLLVSSRVIGTLNLSSKQFNHFDEGDRDLILQVANILSSVVENRQLFTQMQERAEELAIINQVAETVSQHIEPDQLLKAVYDQIQRIMPIDAYHVGLLDAENKQLDYPVMFEDGEWLDSPPVPLNPNSNSYKAIQTAKPVILNLTDEDKETLTQTGSAIGDTSKPMTSSSVFLPLFLGTKVAGVLAVHSYLRNAYDKADVDLLTGIANHVAVALENARLFAESQEHAEELAVLNEMGRTLTTKLDLNSILMDTHRYVTQLLDAKDMYVALYDEETEEVDIKIFGEGEDVVKSALRRRAGNGITEVVLRSRQPLLIKENIEEAAEKYGFDLIGRSSASWLGVPMTVGEKVIGVVAVQDFDRNFAFNEHQQDLLLALSSQVAIAIENVRLFDQEQARAQRERLLREVTEQIRRSSDVDTIMRTAVQEVGRALGRRTYVYLGDKETPAA
ncbi:MAG: GAF domain-containing protein, partial [Anaerolineae bacterium]